MSLVSTVVLSQKNLQQKCRGTLYALDTKLNVTRWFFFSGVLAYMCIWVCVCAIEKIKKILRRLVEAVYCFKQSLDF